MKIFASLLDETLKKSKLILAKISRKPQNVQEENRKRYAKIL